MGERTRLPSAAAIARAEKLTRETFLHPGETREEALAPGTPRRQALDAALAEVTAGLEIPSLAWRHEWSLLLGLERVLSEDEPRLADGTQLNPHQVDALSGTLTALLANVMSGTAEVAALSTPPPASRLVDAPSANGTSVSHPPRGADADSRADTSDEADDFDDDAFDDDEDGHADGDSDADEDEDRDRDEDGDGDGDEDGDADENGDADEAGDRDRDKDDDEAAEELDSPEPEDEEPQDFTEDDNALDSDALVDTEDPGADRRFWFEHATGAGKTVAAMGFVEASRTGGTLILTHRRNLVDQFIDEIKTRGYRDRMGTKGMSDEGWCLSLGLR